MGPQTYTYTQQDTVFPAGPGVYKQVAPADPQRFLLTLAASGLGAGNFGARPKGINATALAVNAVQLLDGTSVAIYWKDWGDAVGYEWEGIVIGGAGGTCSALMGSCQ
jgi:hypothetical protein